MTSQKQSASTPSFASTGLPSADVIVLPTFKRNATRPSLFTKVGVGKLRCPAGKAEALFWDASCRGFGLRALASGHIYQYRDEHKRTRRMALGDVSAVSLDAARQAARQHAASVTQGANPSANRKANKSAVSVLTVIEAYLRHAKARQRSLHHDRAETVTRSDIASLLDPECRARPASSQQTASGRRSARSGPGACERAS